MQRVQRLLSGLGSGTKSDKNGNAGGEAFTGEKPI